MANQSNQRSYTLGAYSVCMNTRCCFLMLDIASFLRNDVTTSTTIGIIPPKKIINTPTIAIFRTPAIFVHAFTSKNMCTT